MKQININLYSFAELGEKSKEKAVYEHSTFLNEVDREGRTYDETETIEAIEANEYLFYEDGTLANCTTYVGDHPRAGVTELKLHGSVYAFAS